MKTHMKIKRTATMLLAATLTSGVALGGGLELSWSSIDGGGGTVSGDGFDCRGTIGQADAAQMVGGGYALSGGLWSLPAAAPCPSDVDGDSIVGFGDLIVVLAGWGPCGGCAADVDGDGTVGLGDLLIVLSTWGPCA